MHWIRRGFSAIAHTFFVLSLSGIFDTQLQCWQHKMWEYTGDRILVLLPMLWLVDSIAICIKWLWRLVVQPSRCCERSKQIEWIHLSAPVASFRSLLRWMNSQRNDDIFRFDVAIYFLVRFIAFNEKHTSVWRVKTSLSPLGRTTSKPVVCIRTFLFAARKSQAMWLIRLMTP